MNSTKTTRYALSQVLAGAAATVIALAYIESSRRAGTPVPVPFLVLYAGVVLAAWLGGICTSLPVATLVAGYIIYAGTVPFGPATLTGGVLQISIGIALYVFTAILLGRNTDRLRRAIAEQQSAKTTLEQLVRSRTTELSTSNEALRQSTESLQAAAQAQARVVADRTQLIDTANAPIFGIDTAGRVTEWNQAAARITGFSKAEVLGRDLVGEFITEDYQASVREVLEKALRGEETESYEFPVYTKGGARVDVLLSSTTRRDAEGSPVGVVGVGQDITERKKAQSQVIQSSKLATLGEMATSVAHELNQPLNVIRMASGNSLRRLSKGEASKEYLQEKLERISGQTERAASIIDHMRMFGRIADESPTAIEPIAAVTGALELMGEQLRLAQIEVQTTIDSDRALVMGHQLQLEQVMINLLTNARHSIGEANKSLKRISIGVNDVGGQVLITVKDTGDGIPEHTLPRIFEPFFTTKNIGEGTGLGLSVSYGIVRDMGGDIVATTSAEGATFTIRIPIIDTKVAA
ncbi:MAG: PAS domain S-box protein [Chromatiales bacterium]|nr:PAS domain S-box protein [Chromatiales bacterium]